jgi:hypothetical protein
MYLALQAGYPLIIHCTLALIYLLIFQNLGVRV